MSIWALSIVLVVIGVIVLLTVTFWGGLFLAALGLALMLMAGNSYRRRGPL